MLPPDFSVQIASPCVRRHNWEGRYLIFPVHINEMLCTCLTGKKKKTTTIRLLHNNVRPRKLFLKSGNRPACCSYCFFFTICYYYYERVGGSCLKLLSETTPKKTLKGFHLFSNQRGCPCFLEGLLPHSLPDDASTALVPFYMYLMKGGSAEAPLILHACIQ